ncbi:hypothetical protein [Embleya sp. NPDC020630]|uniref:hypothetical protein n=1 Tax=Embleya sp. NPDC020630 TaxID=3363979 RepID=UPI0037AA51BD
MARLNETGKIIRIGLRQLGTKAAKKVRGESAAAPSVSETVGTAVDCLAVRPEQRMAEARRQIATTHNQRRFPPNSAARPGKGVDPAKLMPPRGELSVAEAARAMREDLRADTARFRDTELLGRPAPGAAAARPVGPAGPVKDTNAATSAGISADGKSLTKTMAAGFTPVVRGGASGRSSAAGEVNHDGPAPGLGMSRDSSGMELKQSLDR